MQRVLFLITDLDLGGSPLVVHAVACGLKATRRWQPTVVSIRSPGVVGRWLRHANVEVSSLHARSRTDPQVFTRWLSLMDRVAPHVVVSVLLHANAVATACAPFGPRCVYLQAIHTLQAEPRWHWQLQGLLSGRCEGIIAPCKAILDKISEFGQFVNGFVIPNGIDAQRFSGAEPLPAAECPWPADAQVVGYVGRFDPVKRLPLLIDEAAWLIRSDNHRWEKLHLALVGYGEQEAALRRRAREQGIASRVWFIGATATPELWYPRFDVLAMPSLAEGFGLTVAEAMASGRAVLAFDSPAMRQIIEHDKSGWLLAAQQPHGMAWGLARLLDDADLRRRLGAQGAHRVSRHFSDQAMIQAYVRLLESF